MFLICLLDSGEIMLYVTVKKLSRMMQWFLQYVSKCAIFSQCPLQSTPLFAKPSKPNTFLLT